MLPYGEVECYVLCILFLVPSQKLDLKSVTIWCQSLSHTLQRNKLEASTLAVSHATELRGGGRGSVSWGLIIPAHTYNAVTPFIIVYFLL